ncbi:MAG: glutamate ligase domain-containing protein, partial [Actinomycetota bacterium]
LGLAVLPGVPGRMQVVGREPTVVVDYAHTPDALEHVLAALRPLTRGRLVVVFGCGGDRDRGKRPEMARVACALADRVLVTSDNPRGEDPLAIIADVMAGAGAGAEVEPDRAVAIRRAIEAAAPDDVVLVAGKGHEQGQDVGGVVTPFDDAAVVREVLA